jgi:hypothetical protein
VQGNELMDETLPGALAAAVTQRRQHDRRPGRSEWPLEAKHDRQRAEIMPMVRLLAGAKPIMDALVVDEQWSRYQQLLQGWSTAGRRSATSAKEKLARPFDLGPVRAPQAEGRHPGGERHDQRVGAGDPAARKAISTGGDDASAMVEEFEKKNEPTERPLSRRAVKQFFTKVAEAKWEYWFRHEKENGLAELRVKGPFEKAYYSPSGMRDWLLAEGVYKPEDFQVRRP